ncbi:MAG: YbjN domain-containing protein [Pseudomonadota bacterium]
MSRPAPSHAGLLAALLAAALFVAAPAPAFDASASKTLGTPLYKTTEALVQSLLVDEGRGSKIDKDGDLELTFRAGNAELPGWVVFDRLDDGTIWNLRFTAPIPDERTRSMDADALIAFANKWNRDEIAVKLYLDKDGQLQAEHDLPAQYGLNPEEFKENGIRLYEQTLARILDGLATTGQGDGGDGNDGSPEDGGATGTGHGPDQPIKSTAPPDDSKSL